MAGNLGPLTVGITADAQGFAAQAAGEVRRAGPMISAAGESIGSSLGSSIASAMGAAFAALSVGAMAAGFSGLVSSGLALGTEMQRMSVQAGVAAPQLLLLKEAAAQTGADFDLLTDAIQETSLKFGEALNGEASAVEAFTRIGLSIENLRGLAPEQLLAAVTEKLNGMADGSQRVAAAAAIMGDDVGIKVLPMLAGMQQQTEMLTARWRELGAEMTDKDFAQVQSFTKNIELITLTFDRFKMLLAAEMLPYLNAGMNMLKGMTGELGGMRSAAETVASGFGTIAGYAIDAGQIIYGIGVSMGGIGDILWNVGQAGAKAFFYMAGIASQNFGEMIEGAGQAVSSIAGAIRSVGNSIANFFGDLMSSVGNFIVDAFNTLIDGYNTVADFLGLDSIGRISFQFSGADRSGDNVKSEAELFGDELASFGSEISSIGKNLADSSSAIETDFTGAFERLMSGGESILAGFGAGNGARWSDSFRSEVAKAQAEAATQAAKAAAEEAAKANNARIAGLNIPSVPIISGYNDALTLGGGYNGGAFTVPSNFTSNVGGQVPVQVTQNFAAGVTRAELVPMLKQVEKSAAASVQKAMSAGGDTRKNILC